MSASKTIIVKCRCCSIIEMNLIGITVTPDIYFAHAENAAAGEAHPPSISMWCNRTLKTLSQTISHCLL